MAPPTRLPSRESTVAAFRRRDPHAVRAFYREYGRLVYAVALRVLGRADLAEDATQQTFVRAWQAADRIDGRDPAPWLATIAKRVALDVHRQESRRSALTLTSAQQDARRVSADAPDLETLDLVWRVRNAIDALPDDEAKIARLQHLEGFTHCEIALHLGIALGTVKSRSYRAHRKLASALAHLREPVADCAACS
jgi:RNA polymerase sigma-70 factor, ECF subfamily